MTPKLTAEQRDAIRRNDGPVPVEDEQTHETYFIVDAAAVQTLREQRDLAAIREGLADVAAGRVIPLDDSIARIRTQLGLPQQS